VTTVELPGRRRWTRWLSPVGLLVAGLFMVLPFVAVSCDAPGGFGRAAPGGTTAYTGVTLAVGGEPQVTPADKLRPQGSTERLGPQPLAVGLVLLLIAGVAVAMGMQHTLPRRVATTVLGAVATVFLVANQVTVKALLESRLREQLTVPMPAGKQAADYVRDQGGFWFCLLALLAVTLGNGIGWLRLHLATRPRGTRARSG
jgi:hypothetical protein